MTYEEWSGWLNDDMHRGQLSYYLTALDKMYADWTEDREAIKSDVEFWRTRAKLATESGTAALDEALNMGDGVYRP